MERPKNVVASDAVSWTEQKKGRRFGLRRKQLGAAAGGHQLGTSLYELPPGQTAFPLHYHLGNEEAIYVLSGTGTVRQSGQRFPISSGDYVAWPRGEQFAHQIINSGEEPLRFLCFSTMHEPDISVYPDSKKIGVFAGSAPGGPQERRVLGGFFPRGGAVDYWHDEDLDKAND